ncbi:MAG: DNA-binding protein [Hyphomicrobiales bacterium]|nr:DNA-binding protein [Hyphomicrobiales bacterium]
MSEAAQFLCLKKRTLDNMRWMGTGPQSRKHGGRICYHLDELKEWSLKNRRWSTSDY